MCFRCTESILIGVNSELFVSLLVKSVSLISFYLLILFKDTKNSMNVILPPWLQNVLNINSWPHCMKGGKEFQVVDLRDD